MVSGADTHPWSKIDGDLRKSARRFLHGTEFDVTASVQCHHSQQKRRNIGTNSSRHFIQLGKKPPYDASSACAALCVTNRAFW